MYVAGAYITITGGAGAMTGQAPDIRLPWDLHYGEANSPWEVRQKVRLLAHDGVDHIKVLSTGAVLTHGSSPKATEFTPEELQAAVEEARNFGLRVEAHAHNPEDRKSTRLNSSHGYISYAVFCLKKKKTSSSAEPREP